MQYKRSHKLIGKSVTLTFLFSSLPFLLKMKLFIVAALVALAAAEPPSSYSASRQNYGAPSNNYGAPAASSNGGYSQNGQNGGYSGANQDQTSGGFLTGGRTTNIRQGGAIESESDLELENEGLLLPSEIVGQDLLDRVVDALSEELAQQAAAKSTAYGAPQYGPPSSGYGAPSSQGARDANRINLLIPPDPLKAKLIANYIQKTTGDYVGGNYNANPNNAPSGGYSN